MKKFCFSLFFVLIFYAGQAPVYAWSPVAHHGFTRVEGFPAIAYQAADALEYNLRADISRTLPILFSSFVNLNDFNSTSTLGRILGEHIGSRFSQHGYNVIELRLRKNSLHISEKTGEFAMSRNMNLIRDSWNAQAVISGYYHIVHDRAIVSVRLVSTIDNSILSSHDFSFKLNRYLMDMVETETLVATVDKKEEEARVPPGPISTGRIELSISRSTDAKIIQTRLAELDLYLDRIDGIWGRNSKIALERFKSRHQLARPDRWDMPTQLKLFQGTGQ